MSFTESIVSALYDWHRSSKTTSPSMSSGSIVFRPRTLVDRLPNELLTAVFAFSVDHDPHDDSILTTSPMTLSHVCRRWRVVALACGSLWCSLVITYPTSPQQFTRVLTFLSRSKNYPLDILLDVRDPEWDFEQPETQHGFTIQDMQTVLKLLSGNGKAAPRWRSMELLTDTWAPIHTFLEFTREWAPPKRLERLVLSRCNAYFARRGQLFQPAALSAPIPLFQAAPSNLHHLSLVGVHIDWSVFRAPLLTTLELKYHAADIRPSFEQLAAILTSCSLLETLSIIGSGPSLPPPSSSSPPMIPITIPSLKSLTIGYVDASAAVRLLSLLRLPFLTALGIEDAGQGILPHDEDFSPFSDHGPVVLAALTNLSDDVIALKQLTSLTLDSLTAPSGVLALFLAKCPAVRHLELQRVNLVYPVDVPMLCKLAIPKLPCLVLDDEVHELN
ncbi:Fatty acid hydroxylase [Mycena indigotica]|uniref:Fatty acid hydroxylase n=1 Tax=Mycena indigotica TaxID=2126181 RepID=A0A8H6W095_9AGAR|nr:Fatty acid hydroxylase [Mycena indigotica]KAF7296838.1 Fatty acid hydroxylase [Mycena indigotica]